MSQNVLMNIPFHHSTMDPSVPTMPAAVAGSNPYEDIINRAAILHTLQKIVFIHVIDTTFVNDLYL